MGLPFNLNRFGTTQKKRPYYCEVEYLASDGSQYIDTEILGNGEFDVDYMYYQTQDQSNAIFAGTRSASQHLNFGQRSTGNAGGFSMAYLGEYWQAISSPAINTNVRVQISYKNGSQTGTLNGTAMISKSLTGTEATNLSIYIFKRHHYSTDNVTGLVGRIYYFKLWNNGVLVRDMIPVLDWDMTPCMYDKVSGQLFYNQGTGTFQYGREIHYVDYLESTGTQYIDMGVGVKENTVFKATFSMASTSTGYSYFGARNSSNERFQIVNSIGIGAGYYIVNGVYPIANQKYEIEMHANGDMYLDGVKRNATNGTFSQVSFERSLWLFATNYYNSSVPPGASTFWKAQVFEGDVFVRDYLPAIDENGVGFMFDRVTHTCFLNQGTGAFNYPSVELEYIETDGTSYINTGYTPTGSTETEITTMAKNQDTSRFMFGCITKNSQNVYACLSHTSNRIGYRVGDGGYLYSSGYNELNEKHTYKIANGVFYRDDEIINATCEGAEASPNSPLALLTVNTNNLLDTAQTFIGNFYSCTMKENDNLVRDFIPCYKDGVAGVWDKANSVFYASAGQGTFSHGKIIEKEYE